MANDDTVNMVPHGSQGDALRMVQQALEEAEKSGKWMAAVWTVEGDQLRLVTRTTWQFPLGDRDEALAQMKRTFAAEGMPSPQVLRVSAMPPLRAAASFASSRIVRPDGTDDDE